MPFVHVAMQEAQKSLYIHVNRFGVIHKGHKMGKWHFITDLSTIRTHADNGEVALPIVMAAAVCSQLWSNHRIVCLYNNQAVVASLRS